MTLAEHLQNSIETGELLTVIYHGGHAPGTKRKILPRRLHEDWRFQAPSAKSAA